MKTLCRISLSFTIVLLSINVAFAQTERERGIELYEKGEYETAAEILQKAVETDKKDGEAWRFLGMAYARRKNEKQARKAFGKAGDFADKDLNATYDTPVKIISKPRPHYTEEARQNLVTGRIKLAVEFAANGTIKFVVPIRGLAYGLTENTIRAASEIKFEPAIRNGKAVTVIKFVEYSFDVF